MSSNDMSANYYEINNSQIATFFSTNGTIIVKNVIGVAVEITAINRNDETITSDIHLNFPVDKFDFWTMGETLVNYYL